MRATTRTSILAATAVAVAVAAPAAGAAPVVTEATGPNAASIQAAVDSFREQLGEPNGANPPAQSGRRQIVWDGAPDGRSAPSFMPENNFRNVGALFSTPGLGFELSGDDDSDDGNPDADPYLIEFTDINPTYDDAFAALSPERLFAPIGSNLTETRFVVPGTNTAAQTNGFGVVFSDVDQSGATKLELLAASGASLGVWPVPATPGSQTFSFLGVVLNPGVAAARAVITTGNVPLGDPDVSQGGSGDVVAMDDFIYGEPKAIPATAPDTEGPRLKVKGVGRKLELDRLAKGLKLKLSSDESATVDASLRAQARRVEFSKARAQVLLAEKSVAIAAGDKRLKLSPSAARCAGSGG